uniref:Uncharacterized protein n=1 Tax=Polynucleobacter necessarius subsp. necessarius (strain STIR1) TaxID=452638 RepID=B1XTG0_POLNS
MKIQALQKSYWSLILYLILLNISIFFIGEYSAQKEIISVSTLARQYNLKKYESPKAIFNGNVGRIHEAKISFEFINNDPTFSYGNIFQTSSNSDGIRLEFQPQNKLFLILGKDKLYLIADDLRAHQPYKIDIFYKREGELLVHLNGRKSISLDAEAIGSKKLQVSEFLIGTGFSQTRPMNGSINNFEASIQLQKATSMAKLFTWLLIPLSFSGFLLGFWLTLQLFESTKAQDLYTSFGSSSCMNRLKGLQNLNLCHLHSATLTVLAFVITSLQFLNERYFGMAKWLPYIAIPFPLLLLAAKGLNPKTSFHRNLYSFTSLAIYCCLLIYSTISALGFNKYLLLFCALSICFALLLKSPNWIIASLISIASWLSITQLENWSSLATLLEENSFPYLIFSGFTLIGIFIFLFSNHRQKCNSYLYSISGISLALVVFLFLVFRSDSLFIPGSEFHWEYFTGPIRSIWSGGRLLLNTPSQYGFLNILLASAIPTQSSWQALYIFQGSILFLTSSATFLSLMFIGGGDFFKKLIIFLLVLASFFFADSHWIGPLPFPSSSVTRFFCCYILLFSTLIRTPLFRKEIIYAMSWCLGILWSAESAYYCTSIYLFILIADILSSKTKADKLNAFRSHIICATSIATVAAVIIFFVYYIYTGIAPNYVSMFDYAIGYASGYGYVPLPLYGPGNLLLLLFLGIGVITIATIRDGDKATSISLAASAGCLWAVGSYYLGRSVPQNITALFPILCFCTLLSFFLARKRGFEKASTPLLMASIPLFFLVLATFYSPTWWQQLKGMQTYSENISSKLPIMDPKLEAELINLDKDNAIPKIIFSDSAAFPYSSAVKTNREAIAWLPTPLQLLMPPISNEKQSIILQNYVCSTFKESGILIYHPGSISYALPNTLKSLDKILHIKNKVLAGKYEIYLFEKNQSFNTICGKNL